MEGWGWNYQGTSKLLRDDGYVCKLDYGDGFIGVYICQKVSDFTF